MFHKRMICWVKGKDKVLDNLTKHKDLFFFFFFFAKMTIIMYYKDKRKIKDVM